MFSFIATANKPQQGKGTVKGKVISIVDGDTYDVRVDNKINYRIRMEGIDAPEKGMPYYKQAKQYLSVLIFNKTVSIDTSKRDRNKRVISYTWIDGGGEAGAEMLKAGMVWHFKKYNQDKGYAKLEETARKNRKGLWADASPVAPWVQRGKRGK